MIQLIIAGVIAVAAAGGGFVAGMKIGTAEVQGWIEQAAELESKLHDAQEKVATQNAAVAALKAASKKRLADSEAARKKAEEGMAVLTSKVQSLLAAQPAIPEDACASACRLLQQPL